MSHMPLNVPSVVPSYPGHPRAAPQAPRWVFELRAVSGNLSGISVYISEQTAFPLLDGFPGTCSAGTASGSAGTAGLTAPATGARRLSGELDQFSERQEGAGFRKALAAPGFISIHIRKFDKCQYYLTKLVLNRISLLFGQGSSF